MGGPAGDPRISDGLGGKGEVRHYPYAHLDVFTEQPLTGNQLAVFLEPAGLTAEEMLGLTREMGFSETTFVFPAAAPGTDFRVRIFALNVNREIEVAGHPTIGTVFALARRGLIEPGCRRVVLALGIGPTPVELEWDGSRLTFAWMAQRRPEFGSTLTDVAAVAGALGIEVDDIGPTRLPIQQVSCGAPFLLVPVATRAAVDRAMLDRAAMARLLEAAGLARRGVFVFSLEPGDDGATAYSRMFGFGVVEDPATGNASGPLGAYLVHHEVIPLERAGHLVSRQGVKMGRPSEVHIAVAASPAGITGVRIGGSAVLVAEGTLTLPGAMAATEAYPERLFSYGTLQLEAVQMATFGRRLTGPRDALRGFEVVSLEIEDPVVVAISGKAQHTMARFTGRASDVVSGTVLAVSADEIQNADRYEVAAVKRVAVTLQSGARAWAYVDARSTPPAD
jgi:trans-2,3-dihydro-3-hydroxyanthranilate isomerase